MIQTYILRSDMPPVEAIRIGADASICGYCVHRGETVTDDDGVLSNSGRTCYVWAGQGATQVFKAYLAGSYPRIEDTPLGWDVFIDRSVRFGTYGGPDAAPLAIWARIARLSAMHTGYIHRWREMPAVWAELFMASADTIADAVGARNMGYRTFRAGSIDAFLESEALCPASKEAGKKLTCIRCGACNGNRTGRKSSIVIPLHGGFAVMANASKLEARLIARVPA